MDVASNSQKPHPQKIKKFYTSCVSSVRFIWHISLGVVQMYMFRAAVFLKMLQNSQKWTKIQYFGHETPRNDLSTPENPYFDPLHLDICQSIQKLQNDWHISLNL